MRSGVKFFVLTFLTIAVIFVNLGSIPLLDPDEPVYAETPKEMIQYNDYVSPRIYGDFWYDKPPMYYWLVAVAFKTLGVNEYAARFPSAFLGVLCVLLVYGVVGKLFNERTGFVSGLILATSIEYFYLSKAAVTDITLTFCLTASLLFFLWRKYYLFYLFVALATLTKGPIGFLFPGAIVFVWIVLTRNFVELKQMKIPSGFAIFLAVAAPWYWAMYNIHGAAFIEGFIGVNNITRFTTAEHAHTAAWYFFIPVLIAGFFPWSSLLPQAVRSVLKDKEAGYYPMLVFFIIWAAFIFVFFSISSTKLITYILPVYPPLAILVGWYLDRHWETFRLGGWSIIWPTLFTALSLGIIGGAFSGLKAFPEMKYGVIVLAIILTSMMVLLWRFLLQRDIARAFWVQSLGMVIVSILIVTILLPSIANSLSSKDITTKFTAYDDHQTPVYVVKFLHPGFSFYSGVHGSEIKSVDDFKKGIRGNNPAFFIVQQSDYFGLNEKERQSLVILDESGKKMLLKYAPGASF